MAQYRYWDFLSPVSQRDDIFVNRALNSPGIYVGLDPQLNLLGQLILTPGFGMTPDGVIWKEDNDVVLNFSIPSGPETFTITATHVDVQHIGGSPVEYEIVSGIIPLGTVADGVVVGYIYYSGSGGAPLTQSMLLSAPKAYPTAYTNLALSKTPVVYTAEFYGAYHDVAASGPDTSINPREFLSVGQFLVYQKVNNSAGAPGSEQLVQHFTRVLNSGVIPRSIDLYCDVPNSPNNKIVVQVYDTDQVLVTLTGSPIVNTTGFELRTVTLDFNVGTWDANKSWNLRLLYEMDPGQSLGIAMVRINFDPYSA